MKTSKTNTHPALTDTGDLERLVLADAVVDEDNIDEIAMRVHPSFFTDDIRRDLWKTIIEMHAKGEPVDVLTVGSRNTDFVRELMPEINRAGGFHQSALHAAALRDHAARRRAYLAAADFVRSATAPGTEEADILAAMERMGREVEGPAPVNREKSLDSILSDVKDEIEQRQELLGNGKTVKVPTGYRMLDWWTYGGYESGQLIILAARPSVGKTAVMLTMARAAAQAGTPAYVCSLEMTASELGQRFLFSTEGVKPADVAAGNVDLESLEKNITPIQGLPITVNDFSTSLDEIAANLGKAVRMGKCGIAFVDYIGLIRDAMEFGPYAKAYQLIGKITATFKAMAKHLHIPIVLLCQLNRDQAREHRSPELYDLRDSGSIEQDADIVLMLEPRKEQSQLLMWVRKNRQGRRDEAIILTPNETYTNFAEGDVLRETNTTPIN